MSITDTSVSRIMRGLQEAAEYVEGSVDASTYQVFVPKRVDVKTIRTRLGLTQAAFARRFGFPKATLQDWEQGRRAPEASARILLTVIDKEPEAVQRALASD